MQCTVKPSLFPPMAVVVISTAIGLLSSSPAHAQQLPAGASAVPTDSAARRVSPIPVWTDSATLSAWVSHAEPKTVGRATRGRATFSSTAEEQACRIVEATLISTNGPDHGGWCWLVTTDCGDQYQKGDCWYTDSISENRISRR